MQMSKNKTQFIINLVKLPNGFAFDSLEECQISVSKKKNPSRPKPKNSTSRTLNHRIARELALDLQQPSEPVPSVPEEPELSKRPLIVEPEEQISVQIKRQTGLPQCPAKWFHESTVHDIERQGVPEFFAAKNYRTPELYMKYRNFMVEAYRRNPNQYLTKIACRRVLRGDVTTIMKVHCFLEKVGLINFSVSKDGDYSFTSSIYSRAINPQPKFGNAITKMPEIDEEKTIQPVDTNNLTNTFVNKCFSKSYRLFCSKCHSVCGIIWYQRKGEVDKDETAICMECYHELPEGQNDKFYKVDIVKRVQNGVPKDSKPSTWTIEDNMHLLDFVSHKQESWEPLQKNILQEKKNFDEIMLQFMQFPITNFDNAEQKFTPSLLTDPLDEHVGKLLDRYHSSAYFHQENNIKEKEENNKSKQFCEGMKQVFDKMCKKYTNKINYLTKQSNLLESSLFDIKLLAAPARKIKDIGERLQVKLHQDSEDSDSQPSQSEISKNQAQYEEQEIANQDEDQVIREFNFNYS